MFSEPQQEWEKVAQLQQRFPDVSPKKVADALRGANGHAGRAAAALRVLRHSGVDPPLLGLAGLRALQGDGDGRHVPDRSNYSNSHDSTVASLSAAEALTALLTDTLLHNRRSPRSPRDLPTKIGGIGKKSLLPAQIWAARCIQPRMISVPSPKKLYPSGIEMNIEEYSQILAPVLQANSSEIQRLVEVAERQEHIQMSLKIFRELDVDSNGYLEMDSNQLHLFVVRVFRDLGLLPPLESQSKEVAEKFCRTGSSSIRYLEARECLCVVDVLVQAITFDARSGERSDSPPQQTVVRRLDAELGRVEGDSTRAKTRRDDTLRNLIARIEVGLEDNAQLLRVASPRLNAGRDNQPTSPPQGSTPSSARERKPDTFSASGARLIRSLQAIGTPPQGGGSASGTPRTSPKPDSELPNSSQREDSSVLACQAKVPSPDAVKNLVDAVKDATRKLEQHDLPREECAGKGVDPNVIEDKQGMDCQASNGNVRTAVVEATSKEQDSGIAISVAFPYDIVQTPAVPPQEEIAPAKEVSSFMRNLLFSSILKRVDTVEGLEHIVVVACSLDETLLPPSGPDQLAQLRANVNSILSFEIGGGMVVPVSEDNILIAQRMLVDDTGRMLRNLRSCPGIYANGAFVLGPQGREIERHPLSNLVLSNGTDDFVTAFLQFVDSESLRSSLLKDVGLMLFTTNALGGYDVAYHHVSEYACTQKVLATKMNRAEVLAGKDDVLQMIILFPPFVSQDATAKLQEYESVIKPKQQRLISAMKDHGLMNCVNQGKNQTGADDGVKVSFMLEPWPGIAFSVAGVEARIALTRFVRSPQVLDTLGMDCVDMSKHVAVFGSASNHVPLFQAIDGVNIGLRVAMPHSTDKVLNDLAHRKANVADTLKTIEEAKVKAKQAKDELEKKELSKFLVGHQVECKESHAERCQRGQVTSVTPLQICLHRSDTSFACRWQDLRILEDHELEFKLGQKVLCSDGNSERWRSAEVTQANPLLVRPDGFIGASAWKLVRAIEEPPAKDEKKEESKEENVGTPNALEAREVACPYGNHVTKAIEEAKTKSPSKELQVDARFVGDITPKASLGIASTIQATAPEGWQGIRKTYFPDSMRRPEEIEPMYDAKWMELRQKIIEGGRPWSIERATVCASIGEESLFQKKAQVFKRPSSVGVRQAVNSLNTLEGHIACPEGFCVVYTERNQTHIFVCRSDKDVTLETLKEFGQISEAVPAPERWQDIRKAYFPSGLIPDKNVESMYDQKWMQLFQKVSEGTPLWTAERAIVCAELGEEHLFRGKAELFQKNSCVGIREAIESLNTWEGHIACPEGFCVMHSQRAPGYVLLCRSDKDVTLESLPEVSQGERGVVSTASPQSQKVVQLENSAIVASDASSNSRLTQKSNKSMNDQLFAEAHKRTCDKIQQVESWTTELFEKISQMESTMAEHRSQESKSHDSLPTATATESASTDWATDSRESFSLKLANFKDRINELEIQLQEKDKEIVKLRTCTTNEEQICRIENEQILSLRQHIQALKKDKDSALKQIEDGKKQAKAEEERLQAILAKNNLSW